MIFNPPLDPSEVEDAFLGEFNGLSVVYSGGQGTVFKARPSAQPSSEVALKIYYPGHVDERTRREVDALSRLNGTTLVKLFAAGKVRIRGEDCSFVATSFIRGEVLSDVLPRGTLEIAEVARVGHDVSLAISLMWSDRIVHRDIKPSNIMLSDAGRAVLIDLGVARHLSLTPLTTVGKTWGTEGYMAPEHARARRQLSCKADVFSLGIVLQECLIGRHPTGRNQLALLSGGPSVKNLRPNLPLAFASLLDAMVNPEPLRRPLPEQVTQKLAVLL